MDLKGLCLLLMLVTDKSLTGLQVGTEARTVSKTKHGDALSANKELLFVVVPRPDNRPISHSSRKWPHW